MIHLLHALLLRELRAVRRQIEAYPDDETPWVLPPGWRNSGGTLALHLAGNLRHFIGAVLGRSGYERDREGEFSRRGLSRATLAEEIERVEAEVERALAAMRPEDLQGTYPLEVGPEGRRVTTGAMLLHLLSHAAYHLGQLDYHRRAVTGDPAAVAAVPLSELPRLDADAEAER